MNLKFLEWKKVGVLPDTTEVLLISLSCVAPSATGGVPKFNENF